MLTKNCLEGVIAFLPTVFTRAWQIDEPKNRANIRKLVAKGIHCIQCTGGAGEFHTINHRQHEQMVRILAEEAGSRAHTMAGCGAFSTEDAIERTRIAQNHGIETAIFVTPFYFALTRREVVKFFDDIATACPNIGLVHFNTPRSKTVLSANDYRELQRNPHLIGAKQPTLNLFQWRELQEAAPNMAHFVTDDLFVPSMMHGGRAVDSLAAATRPELILRAYELCRARKWEPALRLQERLWQLSATTNRLAELEALYSDCAVDKAVVDAAGFLWAGDPKPPFLPVAAEHKDLLRKNLKQFDRSEKP